VISSIDYLFLQKGQRIREEKVSGLMGVLLSSFPQVSEIGGLGVAQCSDKSPNFAPIPIEKKK
jgi:hypothetical protein